MKISTCGRTTPNANANAIANLIVNLQLNRKDKRGWMVEEGGGGGGELQGLLATRKHSEKCQLLVMYR